MMPTKNADQLDDNRPLSIDPPGQRGLCRSPGVNRRAGARIRILRQLGIAGRRCLYRTGRWDREFADSPLEGTGFEPSVISAIRNDELYVFTHSGPRWRAELEERFEAILAAMDAAVARHRA
jgi:hypothetical protein